MAAVCGGCGAGWPGWGRGKDRCDRGEQRTRGPKVRLDVGSLAGRLV